MKKYYLKLENSSDKKESGIRLSVLMEEEKNFSSMDCSVIKFPNCMRMEITRGEYDYFTLIVVQSQAVTLLEIRNFFRAKYDSLEE